MLKEPVKSAKAAEGEEFAPPDTATVERLNELATAKLSEIVRRSTAKEEGWCGYDRQEIAAARDLLSSDSTSIVR